MNEHASPDSTPDLGRLPYTFSIVGVQKAGTSTLSGSISQHPLVCKPPRKEAHFFNEESYDWDHPDYERDYTAPKRARMHEMVGDATPVYLFWPHALERMKAYNPDLRMIAIFRDPIERLFSHWTMLRSRHPDNPDWSQFITQFRESTAPSEIPDGVPPMRYKHMSGVARGYYGIQLERGLEIFDREQWLLLEFREMLREWDRTVDLTTDHLGLPRFSERPELKNWYAGAERITGTPPTADELAGLADLYAADLAEFETLSGIDTSAWPTRLILDGTLDPGELAAKLAPRVAPLA